MASTIKPIKVWGKGGPNPPKVHILLEELGLPYELNPIPLTEVKEPEYLAINPNGRVPAIQDPNTNLTIWESGAILEYLVEKYDVEKRISFEAGTKEFYAAKQWLFFQVSGQGPYYGQASWFYRYHPDVVVSARQRYVKEINRVTGILEGHLKKVKKENGGGEAWIVGDKVSYVDFAWIVWQVIIVLIVSKEEGFDPEDYPNVKEWMSRLTERASIKVGLGDILAMLNKA
ncbi:uncharacterized protein EAE98_010477 [Botrytis deweyae]|uniref:Glutathione S-transferase n=1 Tax=Botrytis deweyae TaxID=2478750 RepID=A0ABQ7I8E8_9HELO|nr:uncharacterized protein EAE98_010477 [Botrytis deweyae]KAF7916755.1 hypothetical protein EAE98_010477 [Botrytis deweyae]